MQNDCLTINDINPFVDNPPGAFSEPYPYAVPAEVEDSPQDKEDETSPICSYGVTVAGAPSAALSTVTICKPPYSFPPVESCPMSRPLVPMRMIEPGFLHLKANSNPHSNPTPNPKQSNSLTILLALIGIFVIVVYFYLLK